MFALQLGRMCPPFPSLQGDKALLQDHVCCWVPTPGLSKCPVSMAVLVLSSVNIAGYVWFQEGEYGVFLFKSRKSCWRQVSVRKRMCAVSNVHIARKSPLVMGKRVFWGKDSVGGCHPNMYGRSEDLVSSSNLSSQIMGLKPQCPSYDFLMV